MTYDMCSPQGQAQKTSERTTWGGHLGGSEKTRYRSGQCMCAGCCTMGIVGFRPKGIAANRCLINLVEVGGGFHLKGP